MHFYADLMWVNGSWWWQVVIDAVAIISKLWKHTRKSSKDFQKILNVSWVFFIIPWEFGEWSLFLIIYLDCCTLCMKAEVALVWCCALWSWCREIALVCNCNKSKPETFFMDWIKKWTIVEMLSALYVESYILVDYV